MNVHWLVRHRTIRLLFLTFAIVLAATVVAGLFIQGYGFFRLDRLFAFNAWYGFFTCIGIILFAKLLGRLLHRRDDYYDGD